MAQTTLRLCRLGSVNGFVQHPEEEGEPEETDDEVFGGRAFGGFFMGLVTADEAEQECQEGDEEVEFHGGLSLDG